ncbi:ATP-dependent DNA helicase [groundwater metagenome]
MSMEGDFGRGDELIVMNIKSNNHIDNLQELIASGESISLEFKEKFDDRTLESVVAFANTKGGLILIGVSDRGEVKGIRIGKETAQNWANQISQSTEPRVIPEIELHEIDKKSVVSILIKEYPIKPVSLKGRCYRRVGNSNETTWHTDDTDRTDFHGSFQSVRIRVIRAIRVLSDFCNN